MLLHTPVILLTALPATVEMLKCGMKRDFGGRLGSA
jgi:hypothetical protein